MPVHAAAHDLREQEAGCPDDTTDGYEQDVIHRHTGNRTGHAGKGVEQRDRDRHIRAAHAYGKEITEEV